MREFLIILGAEFKAFKNSLLKGGKIGSKKMGNSTVLIVLFAAILFFLSGQISNLFSWLSGALADYPMVLQAAQLNVLSALTLAVFLMLLLTGFTNIYNTLFNSGDLNFLMSTPLSSTSVFAGKLVKAIFSNFISTMPFVFPIWIGFGMASGASVSYYIVSIVTLISQVTILTSIVAAFIILIMRVTEASKLKQLVKLAPLILGIILVIASQLLSTYMSGSGGAGTEELAMTISSFGLGNTNFLPHVWIVKANLSTLAGYDFSLLGSLLPLLALAAGALGVAFVVAKAMFARGWSLSREVSSNKANASKKELLEKKSIFYRAKGQIWDGVVKDGLMWVRQPIMWYGITVGLIGMGFFLFNMAKGGIPSEVPMLFENIMLFVCIMFGSLAPGGLSVFSVSMDGESLWVMKSSPISASKYFVSKIIVTMIPGMILALIGVIFLKLYPILPTFPIYITLPVIMLALAAIESMQITTDVYKPNFDIRMASVEANRRMNDPLKSLVLVMTSMFGALLLVGVLAFPLYGGYNSIFSSLSQTALTVIGFAAFAVITVICIAVTSRLSIRRIEQILRGER